jgi:hypothetical protein
MENLCLDFLLYYLSLSLSLSRSLSIKFLTNIAKIEIYEYKNTVILSMITMILHDLALKLN